MKVKVGMSAKIAWVHDNTLQEVASGGAERTNSLLVQAIPDDLELSFLTPSLLTDKDMLKSDLLIVSNVKLFGVEQLKWIDDTNKKIRVERDYWNLIDDTHKPYKKSIWEGSVAGVFTSPAHRDEYLKLHPGITFPDTLFTIPSPIETYNFWRRKKENIIVYIGALDIHKGIVDVLEWAKTQGLIVIVHGQGRLRRWVASHPNARYGGVISYDAIAQLLGKAMMFIHRPVWVEPYGRTVIEARLSGCQLLLNDRIGCLSYDWWGEENSYLRYFLPTQGKVFWDTILEVI